METTQETTNTEYSEKHLALAKFLEIDPNDLTEECDDSFSLGHNEYLILTDDEADERAKDYILDSVWAFNKSFLNAHSKIINELDEKTFRVMQEKCEGINEAFKKMIDDIDHFVDDAIACDGRGHFLAGYDFEENEQDGFYIYRTN